MNRDIDTEYTAICSAQTIYNNKEGFFGELFESVKDACSNQWIERTFTSSLGDIDKLKILYNEPNVCDILLGILEHVVPVYKKKDSGFSYQRRKAGEKSFAEKDFPNAVILLSQAVMRAPTKGRFSMVFFLLFCALKLKKLLCSNKYANYSFLMPNIASKCGCDRELENVQRILIGDRREKQL